MLATYHGASMQRYLRMWLIVFAAGTGRQFASSTASSAAS